MHLEETQPQRGPGSYIINSNFQRHIWSHCYLLYLLLYSGDLIAPINRLISNRNAKPEALGCRSKDELQFPSCALYPQRLRYHTLKSHKSYGFDEWKSIGLNPSSSSARFAAECGCMPAVSTTQAEGQRHTIRSNNYSLKLPV